MNKYNMEECLSLPLLAQWIASSNSCHFGTLKSGPSDVLDWTF